MAEKPKAPNKTAPRPKAPVDDCRCKEVAKKTPRQLLRVMLDDLAFWKRK